MATLQKCMECEKGATYSMHQFCKQDLSANNYLPNFANDLNIHENPNLSKSSTSNIIADNFSSLDNNFQNLNGTEQPLVSISSNSDSIPISMPVNKSFPQSLTVSCSKIKYCLTSSNGVQGNTLVRNSMPYLDIISKCCFYLQFL